MLVRTWWNFALGRLFELLRGKALLNSIASVDKLDECWGKIRWVWAHAQGICEGRVGASGRLPIEAKIIDAVCNRPDAGRLLQERGLSDRNALVVAYSLLTLTRVGQAPEPSISQKLSEEVVQWQPGGGLFEEMTLQQFIDMKRS